MYKKMTSFYRTSCHFSHAIYIKSVKRMSYTFTMLINVIFKDFTRKTPFIPNTCLMQWHLHKFQIV